MPTLSHHDKQQVLRLLSQQNQVKYIFDKFARESSALLAEWQGSNIPEGVTASEVWIRNANVEKKIDLLLSDLHDSLIKNIDANTRAAWEAGNVKTDDLIKDFIKDLAISESVKSGMFARNHEALKAYMSKKIDGASVSDRVWKIAEGTKENLEYYLSSGISTGRSAAVISQDVRQLLNNPDKRFRRVRNEDGKLILSKPMKNYHPGTGVYRSSYKNALRLAATETNIAYHTADYERWKKLDFVVGIKVDRSPWAKGPCPICDAMKGIYPKGFKFIPWHPFCICQAVPQMLSGEEFTDFLITGNVPSDKIIRNMPETALSYANENKHYQRAYAYTENRKFFETTNDKTKNLYEAIEKTENEIRMNKKFETAVIYNKNGDVVIYKKGEAHSVGFTKNESEIMKDCILTHNHPRGWGYPENSLGRIGNSFSIGDISSAVKNNLSEIRAVTPKYTFVMKRPESGWGDYDKAMESINEENKKIYEEFSKRIGRGTLTVSQAEATHFHILWKAVSKKLNWMYSKAKTG